MLLIFNVEIIFCSVVILLTRIFLLFTHCMDSVSSFSNNLCLQIWYCITGNIFWLVWLDRFPEDIYCNLLRDYFKFKLCSFSGTWLFVYRVMNKETWIVQFKQSQLDNISCISFCCNEHQEWELSPAVPIASWKYESWDYTTYARIEHA